SSTARTSSSPTSWSRACTARFSERLARNGARAKPAFRYLQVKSVARAQAPRAWEGAHAQQPLTGSREVAIRTALADSQASALRSVQSTPIVVSQGGEQWDWGWSLFSRTPPHPPPKTNRSGWNAGKGEAR